MIKGVGDGECGQVQANRKTGTGSCEEIVSRANNAIAKFASTRRLRM